MATTSASWRTCRRRRRGSADGVASIWPRRQRRGEHHVRRLREIGDRASIWPRRQRRGERDELRPAALAGVVLQFGHDVSVVENAKQVYAALSYWLLQFGHDVSVVENQESLDKAGAKGAASIWPRRQRRGEPPPGTRMTRVETLLQFGHDVSVVENFVGRPWDRRCQKDHHEGASIWPRRQRRGELGRRGHSRGHGVGFNLATTSASWRTIADVPPSAPNGTLQFGHDVSVVENSTFRRWPRRRRWRFNLATTSASWRTVRYAVENVAG